MVRRRVSPLREPLDLGPARRPRATNPARFLVFGIVIVIAVGALVGRLAWLQLLDGDREVLGAARTIEAIEAVPSSRGLIYDRAGRLLVSNVPTYTVKIRPADLPLSRRDAVVMRLSGLLGLQNRR